MTVPPERRRFRGDPLPRASQMVLGETWQIDGLTYVVGNRGLEAAFPYTPRQWSGLCAECEAKDAP